MDPISTKHWRRNRKLRYQSASEIGVDLKRLKREMNRGARVVSRSASASAVTSTGGVQWLRIAPISALALAGAPCSRFIFRPTLSPPRVTGYTQSLTMASEASSGGRPHRAYGWHQTLHPGSRERTLCDRPSRRVWWRHIVMNTPFPNASLNNISPDRRSSCGQF